MTTKEEARELSINTGNVKIDSKGTKRKRIKRYQLVSLWNIKSKILELERVVK